MLSLFPQLFDYWLLGPLVLRIALAAVCIAHGYPKLFGGLSGTARFFESINIKPGKFWALVVGIVEFFGGILLIVGFLVQPVALLLVVYMVVAIWKVKRKEGFVHGYEFELVLLVIAFSLLVLGPGAFSIDLPL